MWKASPQKTSVSSRKRSAPSGKVCKHPVPVLLCPNATEYHGPLSFGYWKKVKKFSMLQYCQRDCNIDCVWWRIGIITEILGWTVTSLDDSRTFSYQRLGNVECSLDMIFRFEESRDTSLFDLSVSWEEEQHFLRTAAFRIIREIVY